MLRSSGILPVSTIAFVVGSLGLTYAQSVVGAIAEDEYQCEAFDPEFHDTLNIFIYQHAEVVSGEVVQSGIAQYISPNDDGDLISGTDDVFVEDLAPYSLSQAGPKYSNGRNGAVLEKFIAYTRSVGEDEDLAVGIRRHAPGAQGCPGNAASCFPDEQDGQVPEDSDIEETSRMFVYTTEEESIILSRAQAVYNYEDADNQQTNGLRWTALDNWIQGGTGSEKTFVGSGADWGRLQELRTGTGANDRVLKVVTAHDSQVFLVDATNPNTVSEIQVTDSVGYKFAPFLFFNSDPNNEYDNNMVVFRQTPHNAPNALANIVIWREAVLGDNDSWEHFLTIEAEDLGEHPARRYLLSPEAFTAEGKTWIVFSSSNTLLAEAQDDGNIWIARVADNLVDDPPLRLNARDVNPLTGARPRYEGEVYLPDGGLPVFFYSFEATADNDSDCIYYTEMYNRLRNVEVRRVTIDDIDELP